MVIGFNMIFKVKYFILIIFFLSSCCGSLTEGREDDITALTTSKLGEVSRISCSTPSCKGIFGYFQENGQTNCVVEFFDSPMLNKLNAYPHSINGSPSFSGGFSTDNAVNAYGDSYCKSKGFFKTVKNPNSLNFKAGGRNMKDFEDVREVLFLGRNFGWQEGERSFISGTPRYAWKFMVWNSEMKKMCMKYYSPSNTTLQP